MKWVVFIYAINATINCVSILNVSFLFLQDEVKECLLMKDELVANKIKIDKMRYKRKSLLKNQEELEAKRAKLKDEVKDLEDRIAAGRRGEQIDIDVSFPDLLGPDDLGIDEFLSEATGDQKLLETIDPSFFQ